MVSRTKKERFIRGPQAETENALKGKTVTVQQFGTQERLTGRLVWVDVYSYGVQPEGQGVCIVFKGPGVFIWEKREIRTS